jgi:hypothetical protein
MSNDERGIDHHGDREAVDAAPRWRWAGRAALAVVVRPSLWGTAVRQVLVLAEPGWWRASPRLPIPEPGYLRFRLQTAYGDPDRDPDPADVVTYLHWCRAWPRVTR